MAATQAASKANGGPLRRRRPSTNTPAPEPEPAKMPRPPYGKKAELASLTLAVAISGAATLALLWHLDVLSSGSWEGRRDSRAHFLTGESPVRDDLWAPRIDMPPTFLVFYSETCMHCKKMRRPFLRCANEFDGTRFVAVRIGSGEDENNRLAKKFGVTHVPTLFFVAAVRGDNGEPVLTNVKYEEGPNEGKLRNFVEVQLAAMADRTVVGDAKEHARDS